MSSKPLSLNTVTLVTLALLGAVGMFVRLYIAIPVIPELLVLTPGFLFSELGGIIGGLPGGILVGAIVGVGGALSGSEIPILPMIGNICLGLGTGIPIYLTKERKSWKYYVLVILLGGIIGGFIPSMTIFASATAQLELTILYASIDMIQAFIWAVVALFLNRWIITPIVGHYLYSDVEIQELDIEVSE